MSSLFTHGQEIVQAYKVYKEGEIILAPTYGLQLEVPQDWQGYLSRGSGIFTLSCDTTQEATTLYFVSENSLNHIQESWKKGIELAPELDITLSEEPSIHEGIMTARVHLSSNQLYQGHLAATCGDYGYCVTALLYTPSPFYSYYQDQKGAMLSHLSFSKPRTINPNETLDWKKQLTGTMLFTYQRENVSKKENRIWLYYDGRFKSKVQRTGIFKGMAGKYHGTKKGTYRINNAEKGQKATLILTFDKLPALTLPLEIRNEQYYINNQLIYLAKLE
ncbi:hypothetical protein [Reichenbachiella sp. 5M10]|uniref:hypothetical protein n=1 Tax=Reichenbachiella sp. 5M10 TaxID=1889772 RepID=UPI00117AD2F0|nr:hypothetical protein [Reichenbachiella sp. 5M10]